MGSEVVEVLKQVKDIWMSDIKRYIIPALELMVISFILMFFIMILTVPLYFLSIPFVIFMESQASWLTLLLIPLLIMFYLILFFISLIARSIIDGGTVKVVGGLMKGEDYRFFDIFRRGWAGKWNYMKLELVNMVVQMTIVYSIFGLAVLVIIILLLIFGFGPLSTLIVLATLVGAAIVIIFVSIFMIPFSFFTFTIHYREGTGALRSAGRALRFMMGRKWDTLLLGSVFYLIVMVGGYIPGAGLIIQMCANIFMYQCSLLLFPGKVKRPRSGGS